MIFVDTSAWYALAEPGDPNSPAARSWLRTNTAALVTTDYILNELLTLLRARGKSHRGVTLGRKVLAGGAVLPPSTVGNYAALAGQLSTSPLR